jgi:hypothetical protein
LFDGDRWGDATNVVHSRLVHAVEELPHVGTERLDVSALALGVNGFEGQTRFAAAARARNNRQFAEWKIDIDVFEIVLACPPNLDTLRRGGRAHAIFSNNL